MLPEDDTVPTSIAGSNVPVRNKMSLIYLTVEAFFSFHILSIAVRVWRSAQNCWKIGFKTAWHAAGVRAGSPHGNTAERFVFLASETLLKQQDDWDTANCGCVHEHCKK